MKKLFPTSLLGQRGINLIEKIVLEMGFNWTQTGGLETGIDGIIETRDAATCEVFNNIIQVQSKAVSQFVAETEHSFEYTCKSADLDYWLHGNAPVVLIVSRPDTEEAYWISIKDYFKEPATRKANKVRFNKASDRFTKDSRERLFALAAPRDSGLYLSPLPKPEQLHSNLLEVTHFGPTIYIGETVVRYRWQVFDLVKTQGKSIGPEWELWGKKIVSFQDLDAPAWDYACDAGTVESFGAQEWLFSEEANLRNQALALLNRSLRRFLHAKGVEYDDQRECYFFRATPDLKPLKFRYLSLEKEAARAVFQPYPRKIEQGQHPSYYRHCACEMRFLPIDGALYLELTPTYYFTWDGVHKYRFFEERLTGIKKLEKNAAILGQVVMWTKLLGQQPGLFDQRYPFLSFGRLETFDLERGIDDESWLPKDDTSSVELGRELREEQSLLIDENRLS